MSIFRLLLALSLSVSVAAEELPRLGVPVEESSVGSITVYPDGRGLPPGSGTAAEGAALYQTHCFSCHGIGGKDGINDALAGGQARTIGSYWPYATTVFDYVRRAMPYHSSGILSADETYSVVAYLLYVNGLLAEEEQLDEARLVNIEMPNRAQFYSKFQLP